MQNEKENFNKEEKTLRLDGGLKYRGPVRAGVPHTEPGLKGILVWPNEDYYIGEFKFGKRHGNGRRINSDGSSY